jgi:hypothetical protein
MDIHLRKKDAKKINLLSNGYISPPKIERYYPSKHKELGSWWVDHTDNCSQNWIVDSSQLEEEITQQRLAKKQETIMKSEQKQSQRLKQSLYQRKEALKMLLEPRQFTQKRVKKQIIIPKTLSVEDLELSQIPDERSYKIYPSERHSLCDKYFPTKEPIKPSRDEIERNLRIQYRVGEIEELKKKQFGINFRESIKYYSAFTGAKKSK